MCHLNAPKQLKQRIFYSQLEYVLYCRLPENCTPDNPEPTTLLLTLITTCDMHGCNATQEEVCLKELSSYSKIINLRTICATVGHLKVGDTWAIIYRSGPYPWTVFTNDSLIVTTTNTHLAHCSFFLFSHLPTYQ